MERLYVADVTLRDGEQVPGAALNAREKLEVAKQLAALKVDVIEAGFPASSPGDAQAVRTIAREVRDCAITALARAVPADIDAVWEAVKEAASPQIHLVLGVSDIHIESKFHSNREEILERAVAAVRYAKKYTEEVQYSAEDAGRADPEYLARTVEAVIAAGATIVNIADTTGYLYPDEFGARIRHLFERVPNVHRAVVSVHCHNDLGLATANTLAGVLAGARRVEVTVNGLGERAGNADLEEVAMAVKTRADFFQVATGINSRELWRTSRLVSSLTGLRIQANKAIVGENAFAHSSGIHQDGVLKQRTTYEIMSPQEVGVPESRLVLTARSGRHALRHRLEELGYRLGEVDFEAVHQRFLELADRKKEVLDEDLAELVAAGGSAAVGGYSLESLEVTCGTVGNPRAQVTLRQPDGSLVRGEGEGSGPVDAAYRAVDQGIGVANRLLQFSLESVTEDIDAQANVHVRLRVGERVFGGRAAHTDIVVSGVLAYLDALNRALGSGDGR